ncbi:MAG: DUF1446 domain-containing protein [Myxococcales bacterium]|nr:DUF1446 domain-containing protein [Myxococcales bacterium]MDD9970240.1 DUF1446 domain-containing protein [Myxococcales bacterium]
MAVAEAGVDEAGRDGGRRVVIGGAAGFWGDTETGAPQLLDRARVDYLVFDYLAEITMSIMAGARLRRPDGGYAHDFVTRVMRACLPKVMAQGVKVVTNAGGVHPEAARAALQSLCAEGGFQPKIALVRGDDLMAEQDALRAAGVREMFDGRPFPDGVVSMNAYLGARPIAAALDAGADFVITGRVVDSALVLGPLMHEFGWQPDDYDRLAQGSLAGHIVECGAQATGGLFTDTDEVDDYSEMGFPIVECHADGSFVLTKPKGTSGLVTPAVALEQLVYEIGDPRAYVLPDVVCDFTGVAAEQVGPERVRMQGARGLPPPAQYKVSATHMDGFKASAAFLLAGEGAAHKGRRVALALLAKTRRLLADRGYADFRATEIDMLGSESTYGPHGRRQDAREVVVRLAVSHESQDAIKLALRELPQAGTGMAPGLAGSVAGRPSPSPMIRLFSFLIDRARVRIVVDVDGTEVAIEDEPRRVFDPGALSAQDQRFPEVVGGVTVPLLWLAHGRSGDKGDHCNIGILARRPEYLPLIGAALTEDAVAAHMAHVLHPDRGRVRRYQLPGANGFNFLLEHSLGGGGIASLRADPQGKAFAQQLLAFELPVPEDIYARLTAPDSE